MNPFDTTKRHVTYSTGQLSDCRLRSSYDFPQIPEHRSPTKYARVSSCSHGDVVMLFCSSFSQSERFLQTDQLITRLQVVVMTSFIRMLMRNVFVNVFKSDAVIGGQRSSAERRASFVLVPFWDPSETVPGSSSDFLERSRFVPWPFRGFFLPKNLPWHLAARIRCLLAHSCCRRPVLFWVRAPSRMKKFASILSENPPAGLETL